MFSSLKSNWAFFRPHRKDSAGMTGVGQLAVALAVAAAFAAVFLFIRSRSDSSPVPGTATNAAEIPIVRFTDITGEAGIDFVHENGAYGAKLLPETMGGGVAFIDFDNDGAQDLFFVNSSRWPKHSDPELPPPVSRLYRNRGDGTFEDVTEGSGLDEPFYGMGVAVGDYDGDDWDDLFVTGVGENRLFTNLGNGKFRDDARVAGVAGTAEAWSTSCCWADIDNDGDLDLFVCNYVSWSREIDMDADYRLANIGRAYGPPIHFTGTFPFLYRNEGGGKFSDISASSGVQVRHPVTKLPMAKSLGVVPVDIDDDGWIDLVVANDTVQNFVFRNRGEGAFREVGSLVNLAYDSYGQVRGAMGIDAARFRDDEALGIAIGNFANEMNALYVAQQDALVFADEAISAGIGPASRELLKFGLFFFDYDLDGRLDVLTANGHIEPEIARLGGDQHYKQPAQLFWNRGRGRNPRYVNVSSDHAGPDLFKPLAGRGSAYADIDGDGDLDVVLAQVAGPPLLLRNDQKLGHDWIRFRLVGTRSNRNAIGAWVRIQSGFSTMSRQVMPTRGYLSQSELPVTFGLGPKPRIDAITVIWPGGERQAVTHWKLNTINVIRQSE